MDSNRHLKSPSKFSISKSVDENSMIFNKTVVSIYSPGFELDKFEIGKLLIKDEHVKWYCRSGQSGLLSLIDLSSNMKKGRGLIEGEEAMAILSTYIPIHTMSKDLLIILENKNNPVFFLFQNNESKETWTNGKHYVDLLTKFNELAHNYLTSEEEEPTNSPCKWLSYISFDLRASCLKISLVDECSVYTTLSYNLTPDKASELSSEISRHPKGINRLGIDLIHNYLNKVYALHSFSDDLFSVNRIRCFSEENFDHFNNMCFKWYRMNELIFEIPVNANQSLMCITKILEQQKIALQSSLQHIYRKQDRPYCLESDRNFKERNGHDKSYCYCFCSMI